MEIQHYSCCWVSVRVEGSDFSSVGCTFLIQCGDGWGEKGSDTWLIFTWTKFFVMPNVFVLGFTCDWLGRDILCNYVNTGSLCQIMRFKFQGRQCLHMFTSDIYGEQRNDCGASIGINKLKRSAYTCHCIESFSKAHGWAGPLFCFVSHSCTTNLFHEVLLDAWNGNIMPVWEYQVISSASLRSADVWNWFLDQNDTTDCLRERDPIWWVWSQRKLFGLQ